MNILIIAYYYPPVNSGGTMRPVQMGKYLARFGHNVSILTHTYGSDIIENGNPCIIRIRDISYNRKREGFLKRFKWLTLRVYTEVLNKAGKYHSIYSWWKKRVINRSQMIINQSQPHVIIATYPPVETLEIGIHLSQIYHIPLVADFRDGLMFEPIEKKRMNRYKCIMEAYRQIEKNALAQASAVTTIAQPITQYYCEIYHPPRCEVISNAFDPDDLKELPSNIPFDSSHFNIVFTGRFSLSDRSNRVEYFFHAVRRIIQENQALAHRIRIHLVGEYRKEELKELQDLIQNSVIQLHGFVSRPRALAFQAAAQLLLIITLPDRTSSVSAKIFEYLYAGRPILALTYKTVLEEIINETQTGWVVHPQQVDAIASLLYQIITDETFYKSSYNPDHQKIRQYSSPVQIEKLERLLRKIL